MNAVQTLMHRTCLTAGMIAGMLGCNSRTAPPAVPAALPAPVAVQPAPQPSPPPAATVPAPKSSLQKPGLSYSEQTAAAAEPGEVFEIVASGPEFEVGFVDEIAANDRFTVDPRTPANSSEEFVGGLGGHPPAIGIPSIPANPGLKLPSGFVAVWDYGRSDEGYPRRIRCEKTDNLMVLVPAGPTTVGSDDGPEETRPEFQPVVPTFYMDETEVTLEQYDLYREDAKAKKNLRVQLPVNDGDDPLAPALGLPWGIVQTFASWAGKELPTEVEFEKATRGPNGFRTPWGNGRAVFGKPRTAETITEVGLFPADQSVYGIFDLAGNAREWCADYYSSKAHGEASAAVGRRAQEWPGPRRASVSGQRVVKGNGPDWSAWQRQGRAMTERHADVGFRCVLRINGAEASSPSKRN